MQPSQDLIDQLRRDKIEAAKQMTPEEKLLGGGRLFEEVVQRMIAGIRAQFPQATDQEVMRHLQHRLDIAQRLENRPWTPTGS